VKSRCYANYGALGVYTSGMTATQRTLSALIAIGATISALFLGERVGGPLARAILGPPPGFTRISLRVQPTGKPYSCKGCLWDSHSFW
jgi:hypothetical protein